MNLSLDGDDLRTCVSSKRLPLVVMATLCWRIERGSKSTRDRLVMVHGDEDMGDMIASKMEQSKQSDIACHSIE